MVQDMFEKFFNRQPAGEPKFTPYMTLTFGSIDDGNKSGVVKIGYVNGHDDKDTPIQIQMASRIAAENAWAVTDKLFSSFSDGKLSKESAAVALNKILFVDMKKLEFDGDRRALTHAIEMSLNPSSTPGVTDDQRQFG
jgi:hypothetical protein